LGYYRNQLNVNCFGLAMMNLKEIQQYLKDEKIDGWLMADFHARNNIAVEFLNLHNHLTRRSFYFIPADGEPTALVHNIEKDRFLHVPGKKVMFSSYRFLEAALGDMLKGCTKIAMEYSPGGRLPYIGLVDAGTIELIRNLGIEIVSSADMVAFFQARLDSQQVEYHKKAAGLVNRIKDDAFGYIRDCLSNGQFINERMVVLFILRLFEENGMKTEIEPCCAIDANISNPHYYPTEDNSSPIEEGSLILIDLWGKLKKPRSVYADITWMAYAGDAVPPLYSRVFNTVTLARDKAVNFIAQKFRQGSVYGYEVDDACRAVIEKAGYGEAFFHRTGHSILETVHGPGPNIDNLETEDRRKILPGHLFSIEPGIYLEEFGVRSEINCLLTENGPLVTTQPLQSEIVTLHG
jgi:Xaa-Pro aminopeptidase